MLSERSVPWAHGTDKTNGQPRLHETLPEGGRAANIVKGSDHGGLLQSTVFACGGDRIEHREFVAGSVGVNTTLNQIERQHSGGDSVIAYDNHR